MCMIQDGKMSYSLNKTLEMCTSKTESGLGYKSSQVQVKVQVQQNGLKSRLASKSRLKYYKSGPTYQPHMSADKNFCNQQVNDKIYQPTCFCRQHIGIKIFISQHVGPKFLLSNLHTAIIHIHKLCTEIL